MKNSKHPQGPKRIAPPVRLQRLDDWDNARYAIVPPRATLDERLTISHYRVLVLLGRVNTQRGWCECSQKDMGKVLGIARQTVSAAIADLVAWRYVRKLSQKATKSSFCHYRVLVDDDDIPGVGGVSATDDTPPPRGVSATDDTRVSHGRHSCRPRTTPPINKLARASDQKNNRSVIATAKSEVKAGFRSEAEARPEPPAKKLAEARKVLGDAERASISSGFGNLRRALAAAPEPEPKRRGPFTAKAGSAEFQAWRNFHETQEDWGAIADMDQCKSCTTPVKWPPGFDGVVS